MDLPHVQLAAKCMFHVSLGATTYTTDHRGILLNPVILLSLLPVLGNIPLSKLSLVLVFSLWSPVTTVELGTLRSDSSMIMVKLIQC